MRHRPLVSRPACRVLLAVVVLLALVAACSGSPAPSPAHRSAAPLRLDASVAQFRFDEGTRQLKAGVTNDGDRAVRVSKATIAWDGLAFPTVPLSDGAVPPGQAAAFTIAYGAPQCGRPPAGQPVLVAVVDGRSRAAAAARRGPRAAAPAARQGLRGRSGSTGPASGGPAARGPHPTARGEEYLPGRPGAAAPARRHRRRALVDLGGSVLLDLTPRAGRRALPSRMAGDRARRSAFPVLLGSAHRCDAHALGQSSQTFLLSAYLRLAGRPHPAADPAVDDRRARPDDRGRGPGLPVTTFADVERFALTLPETTSTPSYGGAPALRVNKKMFARLRGEMADHVDELTGEPYGEVLMVGVADLGEKEAVLASDQRAYFTVPHYDGYPAVLVRLPFADEAELRELLVEAWVRTAPKRALRAYEETIGPLDRPPS